MCHLIEICLRVGSPGNRMLQLQLRVNRLFNFNDWRPQFGIGANTCAIEAQILATRDRSLPRFNTLATFFS